jgi:phosphonate transport system substrate-binding protein
MGTVSYDKGSQVLDQYLAFKDYLAQRTTSWVEVEPTFNEAKALERIRQQAWSLIFAPPGLAAIAIAEARYIPLFPLQGVNNRRSIFVVRQDSPIQNLVELQGSATGYYLPLYNLYGLSL